MDVKNKLWIFGDSFSEKIECIPNYKTKNNSPRCVYLREFLNGIYFKYWFDYLADRYDLELECRGASCGEEFKFGKGNTNEDILLNLSRNSKNFKKGDCIIVGFTQISRYKITSIQNDHLSYNVLPNTTHPKEWPSKIINSVEFMSVNRLSEFRVSSLMISLEWLESLSNIIGFDLYYWCWDDFIIRKMYNDIINSDRWLCSNLLKDIPSYYDIVKSKSNLFDISRETGGKIEDGHLGKIGNKILADMFIEWIDSKKLV